jgi:hypothetical protein
MQILFALQQAAIAAASITPTDVSGAVNQLTDFLLRYLIPLAAVGAFSMALIEFGKKVFDKRTKFQTLRWIRWMQRADVEQDPPAVGKAPKDKTARSPDTERALTQLLQLCTGVSTTEATDAARKLFDSGGTLPLLYAWSRSPAHAVFALDLARMMGSIQEAADIALATPTQYEDLYLFMTKGADPKDVSDWLTKGPATMLTVDNLPEAEQKKVVKEQAERFARLRQLVKRRLDGFQLYTADRWASWNQFAANIAGFIVMFVALLYAHWSSRHVAMTLDEVAASFTWMIVPISLLGGIFSPVAKDLVTALQKVRNG